MSRSPLVRRPGGRWLRRAAIGLVVVLGSTCSVPGDEPVGEPPRDRLPAHLELDLIPLGLAPQRPIPADNRLTPERVALGRRLFFDPQLSRDRSKSCASCHLPGHGFAAPEPLAVGIRSARGTRNAPSLLNRAYGTSFFWDGRARSLEAQALQPIENPAELGSTIPETMRRLAADASYLDAFRAAYQGDVTPDNVARALASFQRVLLSGDSPVDRFQAGDATQLTPNQRVGLWVFESRGRCWRCHSGPNYTDESFRNTGVSWGRQPLDLGRFRVTGRDEDRGRFKTPSLRDVARTAPYMHDGSLATLREVVEFYNRGGGANPYRDPILEPLRLTPREIDCLVEFLQALSGSTDWTGGELN